MLQFHRIVSVLVVVIGLAAALGSTAVLADRAYHTHRIPITASGLDGHPELKAGAVVNIHAEGPNVYAVERYMLNGAAPDTAYWIVIQIWFDPACEVVMFDELPTMPLVTDANGNASGMLVFTPEDMVGLPKGPVNARVSLRVGAPDGPEAYGTACSVVMID